MFLRIMKFNDYHLPAGSPDGTGGRFGSKNGPNAASYVKERVPMEAQKLAQAHNRVVSVQDVLAKFSGEDQRLLKEWQARSDKREADANAGLPSYSYLAHSLDGKGNGYKPEFVKIHNQVFDFFRQKMDLFKAAPGEKPLLTVLGGRGGSGKGGLNGRGYNEPGTPQQFVLDADKVKEKLAELSPERWNPSEAGYWHVEGDQIFDQLWKYARQNRINTVLDMTLKSDKAAKIAPWKRAGFDIKGAYMFLPPQTAAERAAKRAIGKFDPETGTWKRGRFVPLNVIVGGGREKGNYNNEHNFDKMLKLFNKGYTVWHNMGTQPELVVDRRNDNPYKARTRKFSAILKGDFEGHPFRGNQYTSGQGVEFVSPSIAEGMNLSGAMDALHGSRHNEVSRAAGEVDALLGLRSKHLSAIGTWSDGAEDSLLGRVYGNPTYDQVRLSAAMKGMLADQKAVIPFKVDRNGKDSLYKIKVAGNDLGKIHDDMLKSGLEFHTLVSHNDHTDVYVFDPGTELTTKVQEAGAKHGLEISQWRGQGEFLGSWDSRAEGRQAYQAVIDAHLGQDRGGAWNSLYSRWRQTHPVAKGEFLNVLRVDYPRLMW